MGPMLGANNRATICLQGLSANIKSTMPVLGQESKWQIDTKPIILLQL